MMHKAKLKDPKYRFIMLGVLVFFCLSVVVCTSQAKADTITLSPIIDTFVYNKAPDNSYGNNTNLMIQGIISRDYRCRTFLKFDLGAIPDGSVVTSAELKMYCWSCTDSCDIEAYHVANDSLIENSMTWNSQPSAGLTYLDQAPFYYNQWTSWNLLTSGDWNYANDLDDNFFSAKLALYSESSQNTTAYFHSSEDIHWSYRPYLEIEYAPIPIPGAVWLFGSGLIGLVAIRKRKNLA